MAPGSADRTVKDRLRAELHWDRVVVCYADRAPNLAARIAAVVAARPAALAVVAGDVRRTYAAIDREADVVAALLAARGIGAGDRVAAMLANGVDAVRVILAVLRLGAVLVPIGIRSRAAEVEHICADCTPAGIVHEPDFADLIGTVAARPPVAIDVSTAAWRDAVAGAAAAPPLPEIAEQGLQLV